MQGLKCLKYVLISENFELQYNLRTYFLIYRIMVPTECIESPKLHPSCTQLWRCIAKKSTNICTYLKNEKKNRPFSYFSLINPFVTIGLAHHYHLVEPHPLLWALEVISFFIFLSFFLMKFLQANTVVPNVITSYYLTSYPVRVNQTKRWQVQHR